MSKNKTSWRSITIYERSRDDLPTIIYNLLSFLRKTWARTSVEGIARAVAGRTTGQVLGKGLESESESVSYQEMFIPQRYQLMAPSNGARVAPRLLIESALSPAVEVIQLIINITNYKWQSILFCMATLPAHKKCKARKLCGFVWDSLHDWNISATGIIDCPNELSYQSVSLAVSQSINQSFYQSFSLPANQSIRHCRH